MLTRHAWLAAARRASSSSAPGSSSCGSSSPLSLSLVILGRRCPPPVMPQQVAAARFCFARGSSLSSSSGLLRGRPTSTSVLPRRLFSATSAVDEEVGPPRQQPKKNQGYDLIGTPHPVSKIRPIDFFVHESGETKRERKLRELRKETLDFTHNFFVSHNTEFVKKREAFVQKIVQQRDEPPADPSAKPEVSSEEMSAFYKQHLDDTWAIHRQFYIDFQKRNFQIILFSFLASLDRLFTFRRRK